MAALALIVEDQPLHARLFVELLKGEGILSATALRGREGLAMAAATEPDLIIVDVLLPDIDGRDVIAHLRRHPQTAETPILAITASTERGVEDACLAAGASKFLCKPVKVKDFSLAVAALIGRI
ncbi:putative two-component system response regulator/two-component system, cell cycle response regulator DivK [Sphingomonas gellani]|uniref:Putative two-component system response regulator/two-component system, cell cycle response regulator DivK n=1 Tax=Sphingomonas gellani TaxID=1166340 RepID=A0A1H8GIX8_9SPHN|nr:response regulator [Sphingomonas gellani]SEN43268.1 putative two-component system response regulator/two-component system, cell cycle response regulator DivK [Sphingomonas gellani]